MDENINVAVEPEKSGSTGTLVAAVVILAILVVGALYFWSNRAEDDMASADMQLESVNTQSNSDEAASIEADLDSTELDDLDAELNAAS